MSDTLWGVIIALVVLFLFGRSGVTYGSGQFSLSNQQPTPNGLPGITTQNQNNPPENQPSPWSHVCAPVASTPMNTIASMVASPSASPVAARSNIARRVSFGTTTTVASGPSSLG